MTPRYCCCWCRRLSVNSHNVAKEVMLTSERKGHILPVHLEPTTIPPSLKYPLAGIQHIELFQGDADSNLQAILRSLQGLGVSLAPPPAAAKASDARAGAAATVTAGTASGDPAAVEAGALAVLPFDNISPDAETDYFSDGLTEELIARLSLVSEIELISRWASMQHKGRVQDIRAVGAELGARYIVGGSVRRFQDSVRVTVQLVDVATNRQLWGNTYKGKLDDIFDIQEQVAQQIVEALKLKLTFSEKVSLTKRQTLNAQAYDLYLRGQEQLYRLTKRSVEYSIQLFEKAIELDPRYAAAYAGCSSAYGQMYQLIAREERFRELAQELSFKALMYDNNLPEAYRAMGLSYFLWGKLAEATASCNKAIEIDPDDFIAHWTLGRIYFTEGKLEPALALFRRVAEIKPGFYAGLARRGADLHCAGTRGRSRDGLRAVAGADAELPAAESGRRARAADLRQQARPRRATRRSRARGHEGAGAEPGRPGDALQRGLPVCLAAGTRPRNRRAEPGIRRRLHQRRLAEERPGPGLAARSPGVPGDAAADVVRRAPGLQISLRRR